MRSSWGMMTAAYVLACTGLGPPWRGCLMRKRSRLKLKRELRGASSSALMHICENPGAWPDANCVIRGTEPASRRMNLRTASGCLCMLGSQAGDLPDMASRVKTVFHIGQSWDRDRSVTLLSARGTCHAPSDLTRRWAATGQLVCSLPPPHLPHPRARRSSRLLARRFRRNG